MQPEHGKRPTRRLRFEVTPYEVELGGPYRIDVIDRDTGETLASLRPTDAAVVGEQLQQAAIRVLAADRTPDPQPTVAPADR